MKDALATAKPQPSDHQPPLPNEGARTISNKVYIEVHPNENIKNNDLELVVELSKLYIMVNGEALKLQQI